MEIVIIISAFLANLITKFAKPAKVGLTEDEMAVRSLWVRVINAVAGLVMVIVTYLLVGGDIDTTQIQTYIEIILTGIVTFATSQGMYFLVKKD